MLTQNQKNAGISAITTAEIKKCSMQALERAKGMPKTISVFVYEGIAFSHWMLGVGDFATEQKLNKFYLNRLLESYTKSPQKTASVLIIYGENYQNGIFTGKPKMVWANPK